MSKKIVIIVIAVVVVLVLCVAGVVIYANNNSHNTSAPSNASAGVATDNPNSPNGAKVSVDIVQSAGIISSNYNIFKVVGPAVVKVDIAPLPGYSCAVGDPGTAMSDPNELHSITGEVAATVNMTVRSELSLSVRCKDANGNWIPSNYMDVVSYGEGDATSSTPLILTPIQSPW